MTQTVSHATISPERLVLGLKTAGGPSISPDGTRVLYSLSEVDQTTKKGRSQLWVCDIDGLNARQITSSGTTNGGQSWSPDGMSIAWVARLDGEKPNAICVMSMGGGEPQVVVRHAASPLSVAWSPEGTKLAYTLSVDPANPDEVPVDPDAAPMVRAFRRLDYKQDNRGLLYDTRFQVMVVEISTGTVRQVTTEYQDHTEPQWSPDGSTLAVKRHYLNGMQSQLVLVSVASGETTLIGTEQGQAGSWAWSQDGTFILFDGSDVHTPQNDYYRYDVATRETAQLTDDLAFSPETGYATLGHPAQPVWLDATTALVHGMQAGASGLWTVDAFTGAITEIARFEASHSGLSVDRALTTVVQSHATPLSVGEIVTFSLRTGESTVITHLNDEFFAETPVGSSEKITIQQGGEGIDAWITFPPGFDEAGLYPVVLDIHGGPHGSFGYGFDKIASILANAGYIVVSPNPRGSGTYGRRFAELVRGDWGYGDWDDIQAALDAVLERPYADAERTAVMGYSYGGFMTSWAIGHTDRFKAAVCGAPVFDLESFFGTSDIGYIFGPMMWGGTPWEEKEWIQAHSPSSHIHKAVSPTFIICGEMDDRCPIGQSEQLFISLMKLGVDVEFGRYPGGSHGFIVAGEPSHQIDAIDRSVAWLKKYLGDPAA